MRKQAGQDILDKLAENEGPLDIGAVFDDIRDTFEVDDVVYHAINVRGLTQDGPFLRLTYSDAWINRYFDKNYFKVDPVVEEGARAFLPFNWNDLDWSSRRRREFAEDALAHKVGISGLSVPIRGPDGQHALFSVSTLRDAADWDRQMREEARELHILAHYLHQSVIASEGADVMPNVAPLSVRERVVLEWSAAGKTTSEIATILGIAERTVRVYLDTSRHKLNATNRTHAVARALCLGLIHPPS